MKLAVFGGTGRVGSAVARLALKENMEVRALVRDEERGASIIPGAELVVGHAKAENHIKETLRGCDTVFSSLNTDKTDTLSQAIPLIIKTMRDTGIKRIVTIGTAGILNSRYEKGKYRFQTNETRRKKTFAAKEHVKVYEALRDSRLEWTIICPTYLPDGESQGGVRFELDQLPEDGKKISVADTAQFAFDELHNHQFVYHRVGVCY